MDSPYADRIAGSWRSWASRLTTGRAGEWIFSGRPRNWWQRAFCPMGGSFAWFPRRWRARESMRTAAAADQVTLLLISGFRSVAYQRQIIDRKRARGDLLEAILRVNAAPGYSEHHTGRAVDIGTPDSRPLEEEFENTKAFRWLAQEAGRFGFRLSYPRNNPQGIVYEPWHWLHVDSAGGPP